MVKNNLVNIKIGHGNKKKYLELGYIFEVGDMIDVAYEHVNLQSSQKLIAICTHCKQEKNVSTCNYNKQTKNNTEEYYCSKCKTIKTKKSNLEKYGVECVLQLKDVKDKIKNTMIDKYGVTHPMHLDSVKQKIKDTCNEKYGCDTPSQNEGVKDKIKATNMERYGFESYLSTKDSKDKLIEYNIEKYGVANNFNSEVFQNQTRQNLMDEYGVTNVFQLESTKNKSKETLMRKYGVSHIMHSKEHRDKCISRALKSRYLNGNVACSKQQKGIHDLIGGTLNYNVDRLFLDIAFLDSKIYVEYNGGGHDLHVKIGKITKEEFKIKEIKRYKFLKSLGWKNVEVNSPNDFIPDNNTLLHAIAIGINELKDGKHHYIIDLETFHETTEITRESVETKRCI